MSNETANQISDESTAPVVAKKAPLFKKLAQFQTPDGLIFETQKAAAEHLRKHLVVDAVTAVAALYTGEVLVTAEDGSEDIVSQTLAEFLLANKDEVVKAYDAAKVERAPVSEETKAKMKAARAKIPGRALAPVEGEAPVAEPVAE